MMSLPSPTMSETRAELRKSNKPLMEKRRRARINASLIQLKSLVLEAMKKDTSRYSKLEKADILDMTVKHLKSIHRQQMSVAMNNDPSVVGKYRAGFNECAKEVARYMTAVSGVEPEIRTRLLSHLANCLHQQSITQPQQVAHQNMQPLKIQIPHGQAQQRDVMEMGGPSFLIPSQDLSKIGTVQLVPGALPTGEVAFFVPNQGNNVQGQFGVAPISLPVSYTRQSNLVRTPPAGSEAPSTSSCSENLHQSPTLLNSDYRRSPVSIRPRYAPYSVDKIDNTAPLNLAVHEPVQIKREEPVWRPW